MTRRPGSRRLLLLPLIVLGFACRTGPAPIVVGSKNFTESVLLGEIVAQRLERAGYTVDRRLDLGGTFVCHRALVAGQLDLYVEYTGTAYSAILDLPTVRDRGAVRRAVDSTYVARWNLAWTAPFGFDNTFAMLIRGADQRRLGITTLSEAVRYAPGWTLGVGYEFLERPDGYQGLVRAYGLEFAHAPVVMDLGLTYRALADGKVDMIAGNATDGQIAALDLFQLADDQHYFPPYEAAPVVRQATLDAHPGLRAVLDSLGGTIDEATMRRLNERVDVEHDDVGRVARDFLKGLNR